MDLTLVMASIVGAILVAGWMIALSPVKRKTDRLLKAITFATQKHKLQDRKSDGASYIIHPLDVMNRLIQAGVVDEDVLIAAVLHDTVEDTDTTFDEIEELFGVEVKMLVKEVTDDKSLDKVTRKKLQIKHAKHASNGAKLIKLADKLSNLSDLDSNPPKGWSEEIIKGYYVWSYAVVKNIWYVNRSLCNQLTDILREKVDIANYKQQLQEYYHILQ